MKKLFQTYPNLFHLLLGIVLIAAALILSGLIPNYSFLVLFPFVGLILICIATWVAYRTENKNLSALGFDLKPRNLYFLPFGLLMGLLAFVVGFWLKTYLTGEELHYNSQLAIGDILRNAYWVLPTAAVQEFICRGYCFKKLVEMSNVTIANLIAGIVFISMHDVFGLNIVSAITYSVVLFLGHLVHSTALLKSGTIFFPIGIHWGNNLANTYLFTNKQVSTSVLYTAQPLMQNPTQQAQPLWGLPVYMLVFNIGFILLTVTIWKWRVERRTALQRQSHVTELQS